MNKLSKEKRNQLILVALGTAAVIGGLWFGVVSRQQSKIADVARNIDAVRQKISKVEQVAGEASQVEAELRTYGEHLRLLEGRMPSANDDLFVWMVSAVKQFNVRTYNVDMPVFGVPMPGEVTMLPNFPYRQVIVAVNGTAYYSDFGRFLADFENRFPYMRIQNWNLEPMGSASPADAEKLAFRMEIVSLVKADSQDSYTIHP